MGNIFIELIDFENNLTFFIKPLFYMTRQKLKSQNKNLNILRKKKAFKVKYKSIFHHFERPFRGQKCLRPESALLKWKIFRYCGNFFFRKRRSSQKRRNEMRNKFTYISIDMKKLSLMNKHSRKTMRQLILSTKFPHHEVR